ncbi:MAG: Holliday junction resolvase RuvX [Candidatus Doudnabacteria bacterium]
MRILALDWGSVRVGAAIADSATKIAFPLKQPFESKKAVLEIKRIIQEQEIGLILLGLPTDLSGKEGKSAEKLKIFADNLFRSVKVPIKLVDERFSSVQAGKLLKDQGMRVRQQRAIKDNIAAQIMLQQYLDTKK